MSLKKKILYLSGLSIAGYITYKYVDKRKKKYLANELNKTPPLSWKPSGRSQIVSNMKNKLYDILVIGGGISGSGCALDATTRGLKVAMVEKGDFAHETSSKSTKLLHGGVRYLEKAFKSFDLSNLTLVLEALQERKFVLDSLPYIAKPIQIMLPIYNRLMIPYFLLGLKFYDYFSWNRSLGNSHYISKTETVRNFPNIDKTNLKGSIVYYDGIHDDSRSNIMIALTAAYYNADILNYCEVIELIKKNGIVVGAVCRDKIKNKVFEIHAKCVISTVGPFTDQIQQMANVGSKKLVVPSSGIHLVVPKEFGVKDMGLLDPNTADGRILFFIPWMNKTILGSTDNPCKIENEPKPKDEEIQFVLNEANKFLKAEKHITKKDVLSAWSGIRPLVRDPNYKNTKNLARNHIVYQTNENLIVLAGGKWTTYRKMAEDAVNHAVCKFGLNPIRPCITSYLKMLGSHSYSVDLFSKIERDLDLTEKEANHLANRFGDRSFLIGNYKQKHLSLRKLHKNYNFSEEEVNYSIDYEMACKPADVLTRRMRLGFIDVKAAEESLNRVLEIFKKKMQWTNAELKQEKKECLKALESLGLGIL